jgi:hypothetical protein
MKYLLKILSLIFLVTSSFIFSGCKKDLDLKPPYALTSSNAFNKLSDFNLALNGMYGSFASVNYYNSFLGCMTDILTDNVYETTESLVNYQKVANWEYLPNEGYMANVWLQPYTAIFNANVIINNIDQFKSENEKTYNRILGQALAGRAIAHFDLLKCFANDLDRNATVPGIPVKTQTDITLPSRNSVKEVYDQIYADLNNAINLLGDVDVSINSATNRSYIDVFAARAAFAKVALYAKDYTTAIDQSTACINNTALALATRTEFPGIWKDENIKEVIWAIQNNQGDPHNTFPCTDVIFFGANPPRNSFAVHPSLLNLYTQATDIRFSSYFFVKNTTNSIPNYGVSKFRGRGTATNGLVNYKVFRTAEMYLIRAEANAKSGNDGNANNDLNTLRTARINGWTTQTYSGQTLIDEIENERRRELCIEGHRWFDLKRTTRVVSRPTAGLGNPNGQVAQSLNSTSNKWNWPIPQTETLANSNISQNTGY